MPAHEAFLRDVLHNLDTKYIITKVQTVDNAGTPNWVFTVAPITPVRPDEERKRIEIKATDPNTGNKYIALVEFYSDGREPKILKHNIKDKNSSD